MWLVVCIGFFHFASMHLSAICFNNEVVVFAIIQACSRTYFVEFVDVPASYGTEVCILAIISS